MIKFLSVFSKYKIAKAYLSKDYEKVGSLCLQILKIRYDSYCLRILLESCLDKGLHYSVVPIYKGKDLWALKENPDVAVLYMYSMYQLHEYDTAYHVGKILTKGDLLSRHLDELEELNELFKGRSLTFHDGGFESDINEFNGWVVWVDQYMSWYLSRFRVNDGMGL